MKDLTPQSTATPNPADPSERNFGVQPLDALMTELGISNHEVVDASANPLTHKMVAKGRKGRRLTLKIQDRISVALNQILKQRHAEPKKVQELFSYRNPARDRAD